MERDARPRTRREMRTADEGRRLAAPRHSVSPAEADRSQQRQARLARTIAVTISVLAVVSASSGYLLHGRAQSAQAASGTPAATASGTPAPSAAHPTASSSPTGSSTSQAAKASPQPTATSSAKATATAAVPDKGSGTFTPVVVPVTTTAQTGRVVTYSLEIEGGMHADAAAVAQAFGNALLDRRGWQGVDHVRFVQVTPAQVAAGTKPQVTVMVASPASVDTLCAPLKTDGKTSCDTSQHVVLNYKLWMQGVSYFKGQLAQYREYMVNHEVGHALGHGHQMCSAPGAYAPVMEQQTLGLQGCKAWPWPKRPDSAGQA